MSAVPRRDDDEEAGRVGQYADLNERRDAMITEIIVFDLPADMTREEVVANYRRSAPNWRSNPDLIRKIYLYDAEGRRAGGVYLWCNMEAARRARNEAWLDRVRLTYGSEPILQYFVTPLVVDNALGQTIEEADARDQTLT
jgi:hypothetical protein